MSSYKVTLFQIEQIVTTCKLVDTESKMAPTGFEPG